LILITVLAVSFFTVSCVRSQPYYNAGFTHIYVTNGNSEIDLISGGTAKIYDGQSAAMKFAFCNGGCGVGGADFYCKVYRTYLHVYKWYTTCVASFGETYVNIGSSDTNEFSLTLTGPAIDAYKVELWWANVGDNLLVDVKEFNIEVVKLWVSKWSSPLLSIERGFEANDLSMTFSNGGTDYMYNVVISVVDSGGLVVTPQEQNLGSFNAGGTKTAIFSVKAGGDMTPKDYQMTFEIAYDDFIEVTHIEAFQASVNVSSNLIRENPAYIPLAVAIVALCSIAIVVYIRRRKPKQSAATEP